MKTFVQLKDGIAFAHVSTAGHTEGIEVDVENPDELIGKKWTGEEWVPAPTIFYALVNSKGKITEIKQTVYPSIAGDNPVVDEDINPESIWDGKKWTLPSIVASPNTPVE